MSEHILEKFSRIRLLAFDLDGVLTNGKLDIQPNGEWTRQMDIKDGLALQLALKNNFHVVVISGSFSEPVSNRLKYLGVDHFFQKVASKSSKLLELMELYSLKQDQVLFMGDDLPDLDGFKVSGIKACPADAVEEVKQLADYISCKRGGDGCVRDVIEKVMKTQHKWNNSYSVKSI